MAERLEELRLEPPQGVLVPRHYISILEISNIFEMPGMGRNVQRSYASANPEVR
jgi:hypothetical protein